MGKKILFCLLLIGTAMSGKQTGHEKALFAGGCFWCVESDFEKLNGVQEVISGYIGGTDPHPTYSDYANKGYVEAVEVIYDPTIITYTTLLDFFWRHIDPTDAGGQFVDRGKQYRSGIFYRNDTQKNVAEKSKANLSTSKQFSKPIVTEITQATEFYPAEEYHQNYHTKNPWRYWWYRSNSGRDSFLKDAWRADATKKVAPNHSFQKPSDAELRKKLTPEQYYVTQQNGTEKAFTNKYFDNFAPGIYVDIISGEPLFSTLDQFKSGTGWPSFTKPLEPENIVEKEDKGWLGTRTEIRSKLADSHLGHVFTDGPKPTKLRYCMNSAALEFIPASELEKRGYEKYKKLFVSFGNKS